MDKLIYGAGSVAGFNKDLASQAPKEKPKSGKSKAHLSPMGSSMLSTLPAKSHPSPESVFSVSTTTITAQKQTGLSKSKQSALDAAGKKIPEYSEQEVHAVLFDGKANHPVIPFSNLGPRDQEKFAPIKHFDSVQPLGDGEYTKRLAIHAGGVTDLKGRSGQKAFIAASVDGQMDFGSGFGIGKAVVNAAGAGLQAEIYNRFGVPGEKGIKHHGHTNFALSCKPHDMRKTHRARGIELLVVPKDIDVSGMVRMYNRALEHAHEAGADYIAIPMAGMSQKFIRKDPRRSARLAMMGVKRFFDAHPESKLKVVFTIPDDKAAAQAYRERAEQLKPPTAHLAQTLTSSAAIHGEPSADLVEPNKLESKHEVTIVKKDAEPEKPRFTVHEIERSLFAGYADPRFPRTNLHGRNQSAQSPKARFSDVKMLGKGLYSRRIGIHSGGITDLKSSSREVAIGCSNNGDLNLGCGSR